MVSWIPPLPLACYPHHSPGESVATRSCARGKTRGVMGASLTDFRGFSGVSSGRGSVPPLEDGETSQLRHTFKELGARTSKEHITGKVCRKSNTAVSISLPGRSTKRPTPKQLTPKNTCTQTTTSQLDISPC